MLIPSDLEHRAQSASSAAIVTWGQEKQLRVCQEELCELAAAISRMLRGRAEGWDQVVEEAADVLLCLVQIRMMFGVAVDGKLEEKLARLESRVAEARALVVT